MRFCFKNLRRFWPNDWSMFAEAHQLNTTIDWVFEGGRGLDWFVLYIEKSSQEVFIFFRNSGIVARLSVRLLGKLSNNIKKQHKLNGVIYISDYMFN